MSSSPAEVFSQPQLLVLSAGRSGSAYIAKVLSESGLLCGHELFYALSMQHATPYPAESSWMGLPYVENGMFQGVTVHQVRDPLFVVASYMNDSMSSYANREFALFQRDYMSQRHRLPKFEHEWLHHTVRYLVEWNERCAKQARFTYQVEDVDIELIRRLGSLIDVELDAETVDAALKFVPHNWNYHKPGHEWTWDDLPDKQETAKLYEFAQFWGYA